MPRANSDSAIAAHSTRAGLGDGGAVTITGRADSLPSESNGSPSLSFRAYVPSVSAQSVTGFRVPA